MNLGDISALLRSRPAGHSLPQGFYNSAAAFEFDLAAIFGTSWLFVGFEAEIRRPGDYLSFLVGRWPVIVVHGRDGEIRAFHNSCRHRGSILCKPGQGSVFWFELDTVEAPRLIVGGAGPLRTAVGVPGIAGLERTLLYVEDNAANLELVEQLIARRPELRLLSEGDGVRGIASARRNQPDVILMDINLPGMSGIQALKLLRSDPETAHIPVLAISANAMLSDVRKGLDLGFFRYLTKPIVVKDFMEALDLALDFADHHPRPLGEEPSCL